MTLTVAGVDGAALNHHGAAENRIGAVGSGLLMADDFRVYQGNMAGFLVGQYRGAEAIFAAQLIAEIGLVHFAIAVDLRIFEIQGAAIPKIDGRGTGLTGGSKGQLIGAAVGGLLPNDGVGGEVGHSGFDFRLRCNGVGLFHKGIHNSFLAFHGNRGSSCFQCITKTLRKQKVFAERAQREWKGAFCAKPSPDCPAGSGTDSIIAAAERLTLLRYPGPFRRPGRRLLLSEWRSVPWC